MPQFNQFDPRSKADFPVVKPLHSLDTKVRQKTKEDELEKASITTTPDPDWIEQIAEPQSKQTFDADGLNLFLEKLLQEQTRITYEDIYYIAYPYAKQLENQRKDKAADTFPEFSDSKDIQNFNDIERDGGIELVNKVISPELRNVVCNTDGTYDPNIDMDPEIAAVSSRWPIIPSSNSKNTPVNGVTISTEWLKIINSTKPMPTLQQISNDVKDNANPDELEDKLNGALGTPSQLNLPFPNLEKHPEKIYDKVDQIIDTTQPPTTVQGQGIMPLSGTIHTTDTSWDDYLSTMKATESLPDPEPDQQDLNTQAPKVKRIVHPEPTGGEETFVPVEREDGYKLGKNVMINLAGAAINRKNMERQGLQMLSDRRISKFIKELRHLLERRREIDPHRRDQQLMRGVVDGLNARKKEMSVGMYNQLEILITNILEQT